MFEDTLNVKLRYEAIIQNLLKKEELGYPQLTVDIVESTTVIKQVLLKAKCGFEMVKKAKKIPTPAQTTKFLLQPLLSCQG